MKNHFTTRTKILRITSSFLYNTEPPNSKPRRRMYLFIEWRDPESKGYASQPSLYIGSVPNEGEGRGWEGWGWGKMMKVRIV